MTGILHLKILIKGGVLTGYFMEILHSFATVKALAIVVVYSFSVSWRQGIQIY